MLIDLSELAFAAALEHIAVGNTYAETFQYVRDSWSTIDPAIVPVILRDALVDAQQQGIEREDIDESWF